MMGEGILIVSVGIFASPCLADESACPGKPNRTCESVSGATPLGRRESGPLSAGAGDPILPPRTLYHEGEQQ